jgi:RNA polymerase-interacting CarD/CdnL/TRCF family regulator
VVFEREGLVLMLREEDLAETVRKPISASEAKQLLEHLEGWNGNVRKEWKARANANQVAMEGGDPFAYADVYKGLSKLEAEGTLRATDREHMKKSLTLLVEEVSCALGETPEQARDQIARE